MDERADCETRELSLLKIFIHTLFSASAWKRFDSQPCQCVFVLSDAGLEGLEGKNKSLARSASRPGMGQAQERNLAFRI
jgi:hypothetical protein